MGELTALKATPQKFYCHRTSGTFAFAAIAQANTEAKAKEPLLHRFVPLS
jgi:hypothetical protein